MHTKIALVGYMGAGKTYWAKHLSMDLNVDFIDLDELLEKRLGDSIASFISKKGELNFRKEERKLLHEISRNGDNLVLATGGGTPCYFDNMGVINSYFNSIYLNASTSLLYKRLKNEKEHRPLISHLKNEELKEFIAKHLFERRPFYAKAHHAINENDVSLDALKKLIEL